MYDKNMVKDNFEAVLCHLTEQEEHAKDYILKNIFAQLKRSDWEGVEVKEYWKSLEGSE